MSGSVIAAACRINGTINGKEMNAGHAFLGRSWILGRRSEPRTLESASLSALQEALDTPLIALIGHLDESACDLVRDLLKNVQSYDKLSILICSRGGHVLSAYMITQLLRDKTNYIRVLIPRRARSSAALFALTASSLYMAFGSELGPLDPSISIRQNPDQRSIKMSVTDIPFLKRVGQEWFDNKSVDLLGQFPDISGLAALVSLSKAEYVVSEIATKLVRQARPSLAMSEVDSLVNRMMHQYPSHDYPIFRDDAVQMGLPVEAPNVWLDELLIGAQVDLETHAASGGGSRACGVLVGSDGHPNLLSRGKAASNE